MNAIKQLAVISGKGGSGKTTFTTNLAYYLKKSVIADCDVDAPDMEILLKPQILEKTAFNSGKIAKIDSNKCTNCGLCYKHCHFDAISMTGITAKVNKINCEGCGFCKEVCPANAIELILKHAGEYYKSNTHYGKMVHARLIPGEDNSGKLVHIVRQKAKDLAENHELCHVIIDGPPGTGCAVMSSITGVDFVVIVTEPTVSGESDFMRVAELCKKQNIGCSLVINKSGINDKISRSIKKYASKNGIQVLGEIPFDEKVVDALVKKDIFIKKAQNNNTAENMIKIFDKIAKIVKCN